MNRSTLLLLVAGAAGVAIAMRRRDGPRPTSAAAADLAGPAANAAEALGAERRFGVGAGIGSTLPGADDTRWIGHHAGRRDDGDGPRVDSITPGLPDFARGA